jgi:hypothetical protein
VGYCIRSVDRSEVLQLGLRKDRMSGHSTLLKAHNTVGWLGEESRGCSCLQWLIS